MCGYCLHARHTQLNWNLNENCSLRFSRKVRAYATALSRSSLVYYVFFCHFFLHFVHSLCFIVSHSPLLVCPAPTLYPIKPIVCACKLSCSCITTPPLLHSALYIILLSIFTRFNAIRLKTVNSICIVVGNFPLSYKLEFILGTLFEIDTCFYFIIFSSISILYSDLNTSFSTKQFNNFSFVSASTSYFI